MELMPYLRLMAEKNASDLFFCTGTMPHIKVEGSILPIGKKKIMPGEAEDLALEMMTDEGVIIHSSIPWNIMKKQYIVGNLMPPYGGTSVKKQLLYWALYFGIKKDSMGRWYSIEDFEKIAQEFNLKIQVFGSMYYPYRFHIVLKKV